MVRTGRLCRGNLTDVVLLGVFLTLAYVFVQRRGYMSKVRSGNRSVSCQLFLHTITKSLGDSQIDALILRSD